MHEILFPIFRIRTKGSFILYVCGESTVMFVSDGQSIFRVKKVGRNYVLQ